MKRSFTQKLMAAALTALLVVALGGCGSSAPAGAPAASTSGGTSSAPASGGDNSLAGQTIKIGGIFDITGGTADVGKPYAEGAKAYVDFLNSKGGIKGAKVQLNDIDYAYQVPKAQEAYKKLIEEDKVVAILGWGTGDTEALKGVIAKDKIPYISGSYSENLTDMSAAPYNFLGAATYSDQAKTVLKWIKDNWNDKSRNPKVALLYNDTPFGKSPIEDAEAYAKKIGVDIVDKEIVAVSALEANSQLLNMSKTNPDFGIIQETWGAAAAILKDAKKLNLKTKFIGLNWAAGEGIVTLAGAAAEGYIGAVTHAFADETKMAGMKDIQDYLTSKGQKLSDKSQKFVQGWVSAEIMIMGVKNAGSTITGETVRQGLEKLNNADLGGLGAPVTFTATNHRGTTKIRLAEVKQGKFVAFTDYIGY